MAGLCQLGTTRSGCLYNFKLLYDHVALVQDQHLEPQGWIKYRTVTPRNALQPWIIQQEVLLVELNLWPTLNRCRV